MGIIGMMSLVVYATTGWLAAWASLPSLIGVVLGVGVVVCVALH
jgi:hypothetical protein